MAKCNHGNDHALVMGAAHAAGMYASGMYSAGHKRPRLEAGGIFSDIGGALGSLAGGAVDDVIHLGGDALGSIGATGHYPTKRKILF